jgi:hypothetical protein
MIDLYVTSCGLCIKSIEPVSVEQDGNSLEQRHVQEVVPLRNIVAILPSLALERSATIVNSDTSLSIFGGGYARSARCTADSPAAPFFQGVPSSRVIPNAVQIFVKSTITGGNGECLQQIFQFLEFSRPVVFLRRSDEAVRGGGAADDDLSLIESFERSAAGLGGSVQGRPLLPSALQVICVLFPLWAEARAATDSD